MKRPIVLLPVGPHAWPSHQYILPELVSAWQSLGYKIQKIWLPATIIDRSIIEACTDASLLIFPLGMIHVDALKLLVFLRKICNVKTPACLMYTFGVSHGAHYLDGYKDILNINDLVIVNCSAEARLFKAAFGNTLSVSVIALPINEKIFKVVGSSRRLSLRNKLQLKQDEQIILYSGRVSAQKNILSLLAVFKFLTQKRSNLRLIILGQYDDLETPHVQSQNQRRFLEEISIIVQQFQLGDLVEFRSHVEQTELAQYFQACDIHVSLTLHSCEDYGYGIAQGLACGIPTVITDWGGGSDLGKVAYRIDVHPTFNGPRANVRTAAAHMLKILDKDVHTRRKKIAANFGKIFGQRKIRLQWKKIAHQNLKKKYFRSKSSELLRPRSSIKNFKRTDPSFIRFMEIYSDQILRGYKQNSYFYLNPLFNPFSGELFDPLAPIRQIRLSKNNREALTKFASEKPMLFTFRKADGPPISNSAFDKLVELGVILGA